ncbi:MAG: hypothetical protein ACRC62_32760 [Microcoleus sp.]
MILYNFDTKTRQYRYADGRGFVPKRKIEAIKTSIRSKATDEVLGLRRRYESDELRLVELLSEAEDVLSYATIAIAGISSGGLNANPVISDQVLQHVEMQRSYLTDLFVQMEAQQVTPKEFRARLDRYIQDVGQGEAIANHALTIKDKPFAYRILGESEHCPSCVRYAERGVTASADLAPPKIACECTSRCKCTILYFSSFEEAVQSLKGR